MRTRFLVIFLGVIALCLASFNVTQSQTAAPQEEVILSWQALNFFPANFEGKALASPFSPILASVEVIENGKFTDLSQSSISWKIDNKFLQSGVGLKEVLFRIQKNKGDFHIIQVSIEKNGKKSQGSVLIPIAPQTIVVELPYSGNTIFSNVENTIKAIPYFFNIKTLNELSFFWQINERKEGGKDNNVLILKTSAPQTKSQSLIEITSSAQNNTNPLEFAKTKIWLNVK
jgi:hypothetical protein